MAAPAAKCKNFRRGNFMMPPRNRTLVWLGVSSDASNALFLFDHLVGTGKQRCRDLEPKRPRRFEVDDQLEFCGLLDGKFCGALPIENAPHIVAGASEHGWIIRSIGHQAAALNELPCAEHCGDRILVGEAYNRFSRSE